MIKLIAKPLEWLKWLWDLTFPMFSTERRAASDGQSAAARWVARIIVIAVFLFILALINRAEWSRLDSWIESPSLRRIWLSLVALCLYVMLWLGWWLYRVLSRDIEPVSSEFPDIDRAWSQAVEALTREEIHLDNTPLFLVLGWPSKSETSFFQSAGVRAVVKQVPANPDGPLHVTASREGIWLTCPGASLLGQYNPNVLGEASPEATLAGKTDDGSDPFKSIGIGQGGGETLRVEDFIATFREAQARARARPKRVGDPEYHAARLRHLARLISRDRRGFCPINGILIALPISVVDSKSDADEIAAACRADLTAAFDVFRMRCPVLTMICGLEDLPGFAELVDHLPADQLRKRMGQRFALVPNLPASAVPEKIEGAVESITSSLFPSMVFALFQIEAPGGEATESVLKENCQLFRFLNATQEKQDRLAHLVKDCLPTLHAEPIMFGGCYFAGTGLNSANEHAFASGVLMRMVREDQDSVTWTAATLSDDAAAWRQARYVKIALILIIALGVLFGVALVGRPYIFKSSTAETSVSE
jgi:hypothetical protein